KNVRQGDRAVPSSRFRSHAKSSEPAAQTTAPHRRRFHQSSLGGLVSEETETNTARQFASTSFGFVKRYSTTNFATSNPSRPVKNQIAVSPEGGAKLPV